MFEECSGLLVRHKQGEEHGVDHYSHGEVCKVWVLGRILQKNNMHHSWTNQAKAIYEVQPFKTDSVLNPWFSMFTPFEPEEDLDAWSCYEHEEGIDDLNSNTNIGQGLVPVVQGGVC